MRQNSQITRLPGKWAILLLTGLFATMYTYEKAAGTSFAAPIEPPGACLVNDTDFNTEDGGCRDLATGIVWGVDTAPAMWTWDFALDYCENLDEGGYSDWALPTVEELVDVALNEALSEPVNHLALDWGYPSMRYWSRIAKGGQRAWMVYFPEGDPVLVQKRSATSIVCNRHPNSGGNDAPTDLTATTVSSSEIDLTWTDRSADEDRFEIERSLDGVIWPPSPTATVGPNVASYSDAGLTKKTMYYYRVRAYGPSGYSDYSNTDNAKTKNR